MVVGSGSNSVASFDMVVGIHLLLCMTIILHFSFSSNIKVFDLGSTYSDILQDKNWILVLTQIRLYSWDQIDNKLTQRSTIDSLKK